MSVRSFVSFSVLAILAVVTQSRLTTAQAKKAAANQSWSPPLTPYGQPDLQGVWISRSATPLERPKALEGRQFLTDEEVRELKTRADRIFANGKSDYGAGDNAFLAALADVEQFINPLRTTGTSDDMIEREFDNRTSLIVDPPDGKIPWTAEGLLRQTTAVESRQARDPAGPEDLTNDMRCLTFGVPRLGGNYGAGPYSYYQIVQSPGYVVLHMEYIHEARIIPLDGRPHLPESIRQWNGDSRGRWEGSTLVVDTTNFSPRSFFMGSSENLHLVERFTRVAPGTIKYEVTLSDGATWKTPWTADIYLKQTQEKLYEVACHEGNFEVLRDIFAGARAGVKPKL